MLMYECGHVADARAELLCCGVETLDIVFDPGEKCVGQLNGRIPERLQLQFTAVKITDFSGALKRSTLTVCRDTLDQNLFLFYDIS